MVRWTSLTVYSVAALTTLVGVAEIVLASLVLRDLHELDDEYDYAVDGGSAQSSPYIYVLPGQTLVFDEPWVLVQSDLIWDVPKCELAAGAVACAFAIIASIYTFVRDVQRSKAGIRKHRVAVDGTATVVLAIFCGAVLGLFGHVFTVIDYSEAQSKVYVQDAVLKTAWDATPTWEVWTCSVARYLSSHPSVEGYRPKWESMCQLTTSSRWTLLPLAILSVLLLVAAVIGQCFGGSDTKGAGKVRKDEVVYLEDMP